MIPAAFDYVRAKSLSHAIDLLVADPDGAKIVAGGHSLIPALKQRMASPSLLVDVNGLDELKGIAIGEDQVRIGALSSHADILASDELFRVLPVFRTAARVIADPQVRNRGTIGGALANADPAADWPAVVIALDGLIELAGPRGTRSVPAGEFFVDIMTTAIGLDEVLVAVHVPLAAAKMKFTYRKIRHPASGYAVVGAAVGVKITDGIIEKAAIGITGASGFAFRATAAEGHLRETVPTPETIAFASDLAGSGTEFLSDHYASSAYRAQLVRTEVGRALKELAQGAVMKN
ncbi:FAD binding domain-containing protein [Tardiphaga sp. 804_B3_N1_9]|uniref:FAD binding domain-containing protein n=1 Tax=Tardiphaga sp. 804_B3_N1_9 TaxID=3240786 RepID=UPI003F2365A5